MSWRILGFFPVVLLVLGVSYFGGASANLSGAGSGDKTVSVSSEDAEMNAAMQKARDTLPMFWTKHASPESDEESFSVKLGISDGKNVEHFWCGDIKGDAAKASCTISNEPQSVFTVKMGQRVDIDALIISDWMYMKSGKIKGGQTIRALIPKLSEEEAQSYRAMLADE